MGLLNRAATEWLVARFVGESAAEGDDSFGALVEEHFGDDEAMMHLARIVRAAETPERFGVMPESAGLRAVLEGWSIANRGKDPGAVFDAVLALLRERIQAGEPVDTDPLLDGATSLPNRLLLSDRLTHAIAFAHRHDTQLAVCWIRFDFSAVAGHEARVAREIADRLRHAVREVDTISRPGDGEFCIVITDVPQREHAEIALAKVIDLLNAPFDIGERAYTIPVHFGISLYPRHGHDATSLIRAAREAATAGRTVSVFGET